MKNENCNLNEESCRTQCEKIAEWLKAGNSVTQMQALRMFRCFRLASRIHDLRASGMEIGRTFTVLPSGKRVAEYFLIEH